ncbi:hypothetical protein CR513_03480, partial [Mucuna pruriens]
ACVHHLAPLKLDHTPLWVKFQSNPRGNRHKRLFRLMVAWLRHDNFSNHISHCWRDIEVFGDITRKKCILLHRPNMIASNLAFLRGPPILTSSLC